MDDNVYFTPVVCIIDMPNYLRVQMMCKENINCLCHDVMAIVSECCHHFCVLICHHWETHSALLALFAGNSQVNVMQQCPALLFLYC